MISVESEGNKLRPVVRVDAGHSVKSIEHRSFGHSIKTQPNYQDQFTYAKSR